MNRKYRYMKIQRQRRRLHEMEEERRLRCRAERCMLAFFCTIGTVICLLMAYEHLARH